MARETKVGLLIGLGMILLIGIIVSDYISVINDQDAPAGLTDFARSAQESIDPMATAPRAARRPGAPRQDRLPPSDPSTEAAMEGGRAPSSLTRPAARLAPIPTADELRQTTPLSYSTQTPAKRPPPPARPSSPPPAPASPLAPDGGHDALARDLPSAMALDKTANRISGFTDRIPQKQAKSLSERSTSSQPPNPKPRTRSSPPNRHAPASPRPRDIIHTMRSGETLAQLARQYYGNAQYWKSIAEANPAVVDDKGRVRAGVRVVIPNRAEGVNARLGELAKAAEAGGVRIEPIVRRGGPIDVTPRGNVAAPPTATEGASPPATLKVEKGDTLSGLAGRYLGSQGQWKRLLKANADRLDKPEDLRAGMTLKLPPGVARPATPNRARATKPAGAGPADAGNPHTYTVRSGDTLAAIARKQMGDADQWHALYRANRDKIEDANDLSVGTQLRIPS